MTLRPDENLPFSTPGNLLLCPSCWTFSLTFHVFPFLCLHLHFGTVTSLVAFQELFFKNCLTFKLAYVNISIHDNIFIHAYVVLWYNSYSLLSWLFPILVLFFPNSPLPLHASPLPLPHSLIPRSIHFLVNSISFFMAK